MRRRVHSPAARVRAFAAACALCVGAGAQAGTAAAPAVPTAATPAAAPSEVERAMPAARLVGAATMQFVGFEIYEARLWAAPGFAAEHYPTQAFALELRYAREFDREAIAQRSIAEMRRVGDFDPAQERAWRDQLLRAIPDVKAGDRLTGVRDAIGATRFFANGRPTGTIADPEFGRLFFGIWLAPQTSEPALRRGLIGRAS